MLKHIYDKVFGRKLLRTEEAEPKCGKDFCDACGDCLHCYAEDACQSSETGLHHWVEYEEDNDAKR